jgi:hypothetical protein
VLHKLLVVGSWVFLPVGISFVGNLHVLMHYLGVVLEAGGMCVPFSLPYHTKCQYHVDSGAGQRVSEKDTQCKVSWDFCFLTTCTHYLDTVWCPLCVYLVVYSQTWLILPVVICLSQRLSHACLSISFYTVKLRMAH